MPWVNNLRDGIAWTMLDSHSRVGQIYIPTAWIANENTMSGSISPLLVGQPMTNRFRINLSSIDVLTPTNTDINQSVKLVWRITAHNTSNGLRQVIDFPCANANLLPSGTNLANIGAEPFATFVADLENTWNSETSGVSGPMVVEQIKLTGVK